MSKKQYASDFGVEPQEAKTVSDKHQEGIRVLVKSVRGSHFCVYLGVPSAHPAAGLPYDDVSINCHGGLTFAGEGDGKFMPKGYYWYGYDYAHAGDKLERDMPDFGDRDEHRWTLDEVLQDAWGAVYDLKHFMASAEKIAERTRAESNNG